MELNWNPPEIQNRLATLSWDAAHAEDVFFGEPIAGGERTPDRRFTEPAIAQTDFEAVFAEKLEESDGDINAAFERTAEQLGDTIRDVIEHHEWDLEPGGRKRHKNAPTWVTIDDSGELASSLDIQLD